MTEAKVYYTDMRAHGRSLLSKLRRLMKEAGFESIDFDGKFVAVKIHFGEPGNLADLRPNWAAEVCDYIRELGGKPFLTDCNTLYVGGRKNALDHLDSAYKNGYNPFQTGVHTIIADGLKGTDEALIPVEGGEYSKEAKIGRAIADADVVISLSHFKGHELTGFGGAIKNLGMGSGSRAGKMEMHSAGKPFVRTADCIGCGRCNFVCPTCTCFTMQDISYRENADVGERRRVWASCQVDGYTDIAGGNSFRQKQSDRMRFKVMHKIYDFEKRFGFPMCVGCGRCDTVCPEYISYSNIIQQLAKEEEDQ